MKIINFDPNKRRASCCRLSNGRSLIDLRMKHLKYAGINTRSVYIIYLFCIFVCVHLFIYVFTYLATYLFTYLLTD